MSNNSSVHKDLKHIICISGIVVLSLVGFIFFSPLSLHFYGEGLSRGDLWETEIDDLISSKHYAKALHLTDSIIEVKRERLPRYSYFDRFLSEDERIDVMNARYYIYDLQWKRIEILHAKHDFELLIVSIIEYSKINGYNQDKAKALLKDLKDK